MNVSNLFFWWVFSDLSVTLVVDVLVLVSVTAKLLGHDGWLIFFVVGCVCSKLIVE